MKQNTIAYSIFLWLIYKRGAWRLQEMTRITFRVQFNGKTLAQHVWGPGFQFPSWRKKRKLCVLISCMLKNVKRKPLEENLIQINIWQRIHIQNIYSWKKRIKETNDLLKNGPRTWTESSWKKKKRRGKRKNCWTISKKMFIAPCCGIIFCTLWLV